MRKHHIQSLSHRIIPRLGVLSMAAVLAACVPDPPRAGGNPSSHAEPAEPAPGPPPKTLKGKSLEIEKLTGAHTKLVWSQYQKVGGADTFASGRGHILMGFDTRDGLGERVVLKKMRNYGRPLITPDGDRIVFSDKNVSRKKKGGRSIKHYKPVIHSVNWDGSELKKVGKGMAVDLWKDPKTGVTWVYAASPIVPSYRIAMFGKKIVRFPLEDPGKVEKVWDKGQVSVDNFQVSGDAAFAGGLFPWPYAGYADLKKGTWQQVEHGCWTSTAPDESRVFWVFDGAHRNLRMFRAGYEEGWTIPLHQAPGIKGYEVYHPRWSNHVRFLTMTGPYITGKGKGSSIGGGGEQVEVFVGKFSPDLAATEGWVQVTKNKRADLFPDLWVEGGERSRVDTARLPTAGKAVAGTQPKWPAERDGLQFVWEHNKADNRIEEETGAIRQCRLEARGTARFGRHFDLLTGGGSFVTDAEINQALTKAFAATGQAAFEVIVTPRSSGAETPETILAFRDPSGAAGFSLLQRGDSLIVAVHGNEPAAIGTLKADRPSHVVVSISPEGVATAVNGDHATAAALAVPYDASKWTTAALTLGASLDGNDEWDGRLEGIAVYNRAIGKDSCRARFLTAQRRLEGRAFLPVTKLNAKLIEITPNPTLQNIGEYHRALVAYLYEVGEVAQGDYKEKQIVVLHWVVMERKPLPGWPREVGQTYELKVQALVDHPELESERASNTTSGFALPAYFDISPPAIRPGSTEVQAPLSDVAAPSPANAGQTPDNSPDTSKDPTAPSKKPWQK